MRWPLIPAVLMAMLQAHHAAAQNGMRGFSTSRPVAPGQVPLRASLEFGAGRVSVLAGNGATLYRMLVSYDSERFSPVHRYDQRTGILELGVSPTGSGGLRVSSSEHLEQAARFEFSPDVPLILRASLGASNAVIDLGGMMLEELTVRSGATRGTVTFSSPTRGQCRQATFVAGAGELLVRNLAQAGCPVLKLEGDAGRTIMDFGGRWLGNIRVAVDISVGGVILRIPRGTGLRVTADRFLASMTAEGLSKTDDGWESPDFAEAERKIAVAIRASVAGIAIEWIDQD